MKKHFILGTLFLSVILLLVSCYTPSPLYGTWSDTTGNKITFMADGTFSARIKLEDENIDYDGSYTVIDNVLIFTYESGSIYSIWDINGATVKLTWADKDTSINLILYHIAR